MDHEGKIVVGKDEEENEEKEMRRYEREKAKDRRVEGDRK